MNKRWLIILCVFLTAATAAILVVVNFYFLGGEKAQIQPRRFTAEEVMREKPAENLAIKDFEIKSKSDDGRFRVKTPIEIKCTIENTSAAALKNFRSVIRTPLAEIASVKTAVLKPAQKFTLQGTLLAENTGVLIVACRADIEKKIDEENENDNREVVVLYIHDRSQINP